MSKDESSATRTVEDEGPDAPAAGCVDCNRQASGWRRPDAQGEFSSATLRVPWLDAGGNQHEVSVCLRHAELRANAARGATLLGRWESFGDAGERIAEIRARIARFRSQQRLRR